MADATRAALAESDAVIARIRTRLAGAKVSPDGAPIHGDLVTGYAATAARIADEWERYALELVHESTLAEASQRFRERWPALVQWRERVLRHTAHKGRARPSLVAAAYESLALECTLAGEHALAAKAQQAALSVMRSVRPIRQHDSVDAAQSA